MSAAEESEAQTGEVEFAECGCCGLTEECTVTYIARVRERHGGRWVCDLCAEAVEDEIRRSDLRLTTEQALHRHTNFCNRFRSSSPSSNPTEAVISAVRHILRHHAHRSTPNTPKAMTGEGRVLRRPSLSRSDSCFPTSAS